MAPASRSPKRRRRSDKRRAAERRRRRDARRADERREERDTLRTTRPRGGRERRRAVAVLAGCVALLLLLGLGAYLLGDWESPPAEWRVTGFDARVTVHASGSVDMVETITYDFGDRPSHGLTRELPETGWIDGYGWRDFALTGVRARSTDGLPVRISPGEGDPRAESRTVVRVGDFGADPALTGEHVFEIAYTYERLTTPAVDGGADYYADIVGSGWSVPVESTTATFHLPDLPARAGTGEAGERGESEELRDGIGADCHAGDVGDRGGCADVAWAETGADTAGPLLTAGHGRLSPGQAMSVRLSLPPSVYSADPADRDEGSARPEPPSGGLLAAVVGIMVLGCFAGLAVGLNHLAEYLFGDGSGSGSGSRSAGAGAGGGGGGGGGGGAGGGGGGGGGG